MRFTIRALLLLAACASFARAQSAHWEPSRGTLAVGQTTELQLVLEDCSMDQPPALPPVDGLTVQFAGKSSNTSIINGTFSQTEVLAFAALLSKHQVVDIPPFDIVTNKGKVRVPSAHFEPGTSTVGDSGLAIEDVASSRLSATPSTVWAGQVFDIGYSIDVEASYRPEFGNGQFTWDPSPLAIEDWSQPEQFQSQSAGRPRVGLLYKTRAIARTPGQFPLASAHQLVNLNVGTSGFGFFAQRQIQQFSVPSTAPSIEVMPLPSPPQGFSGAVGQFKITSKVVPQTVAVGDPVTWSIDLSGRGNWPDIKGLPAREVSRDFQVVQPKAKRTPQPGKLFDATLSEDVVLLPTKPGTYTLGSVEFVYFDPKKGAYQTLRTAPATITVTPAAPTAPPSAQASAPSEPPADHPSASKPDAPGALPRDPLPDSGKVVAPMLDSEVVTCVAGCLLFVPLAWLVLAYRRARSTDTSRTRRLAYGRLDATLSAIASASPESMPALLRSWQADTALLLGLPQAAPSRRDLASDEWSRLWAESEDALYGAQPRLADDWVRRARAAWEAARVPSFSASELFLKRNLLPFLGMVVLLLAGTPARAEGSAAEDYRSGNFAAAQASWKALVAHQPTNWSARYNLSLALGQQDRWGESAAHAVAAFVQNPSEPSVEWQFALSSDKAGFVPTVVGDFIKPSPSESVARWCSPARWQRLIIDSAIVDALGLIVLLLGVYGLVGRKASLAVGLSVLALGLGLGLVSWGGVRAYGLAADARAVMVWRSGTLRSVPTEAEVQQKTSSVGAGTVAIVDKTFLTWVRLRFEGGETGWVRQDEVISLWR